MASFILLKRLAALALTFGVMGAARSQPVSESPEGDRIESMEARGTVGPYRIGLNYTLRQHAELISAHYFYVTQLRDIPLRGSVRGAAVDFEGEDGSTFHLHMVGNVSNGSEALTFSNSIGLSGSWTLGRRTLPVELRMQHSTENPGVRLYAQVTDQPDSAYETMVTKLKRAILHGDEIQAAKYIQFPLRVNGQHRSLTIRNAAELKTNWSRIFTPEFVAKLRTDAPHEMFVHEGEVMLGDGELWFGARGLVSLNTVPSKADVIEGK